MGKINWGRVVLGGVVWSAVFNVPWAFAIPSFLRSEWAPVVERQLGRPFLVPPRMIALVLVLTLIAGILSIWFYAAIRPRYGPGPKTAAIAGVVLWLIGNLGPTLWWGWYLLQLPSGLITAYVAINLVTFVAATLVGAWPYKE